MIVTYKYFPFLHALPALTNTNNRTTQYYNGTALAKYRGESEQQQRERCRCFAERYPHSSTGKYYLLPRYSGRGRLAPYLSTYYVLLPGIPLYLTFYEVSREHSRAKNTLVHGNRGENTR